DEPDERAVATGRARRLSPVFYGRQGRPAMSEPNGPPETNTDRAVALRSFPFARRTGQLGKSWLAQALVILGGVAIWISHQFIEHDWWMTLDFAGLVLGLVGFIWWARSVAC